MLKILFFCGFKCKFLNLGKNCKFKKENYKSQIFKIKKERNIFKLKIKKRGGLEKNEATLWENESVLKFLWIRILHLNFCETMEMTEELICRAKVYDFYLHKYMCVTIVNWL